MILPTRRTFWVLLALTPLLAIAFASGASPKAGLAAAGLGALALLCADALWLRGAIAARASLASASDHPVGVAREFLLDLEGPLRHKGARLDLVVSSTGPVELQWPSQRALGGGSIQIVGEILGLFRGPVRLHAAHLMWRSPLGLVAWIQRLPLAADLRIVQDRERIAQLALQVVGQRQARMGLRLERFAGEGTEFRGLKDYLPGLDPRHIDWSASARKQELVWREHRAERDQSIILCFDTGRRMMDRALGLSRMDHALQIGLAFAMTALRTGDRVGLLAFDDEPRVWIPPAGGVRAYAPLERAASETLARPVGTNLAKAAAWLLERVPRRSLVLLFSEFGRGEGHLVAEDLMAAVARRHLLIPIAFPGAEAELLRGAAPSHLEDLHLKALAALALGDRQNTLAALQNSGIVPIEAHPHRALESLFARYLEVKRTERIA